MNYSRRFRFTAVICAGFLGASLVMAQNKTSPTAGKPIDDAVRVTLISDSERYELKAGVPISVVVRIESLSDERLKLRHSPVFNFERTRIPETDNTKLIFGNYYTGRIASRELSNSTNLVLEKGKHLEFIVDVAALELKDGMSSINVWRNIFKEMEKGEYDLWADATVDFTDDKKELVKEFQSNKIVLTRRVGNRVILKRIKPAVSGQNKGGITAPTTCEEVIRILNTTNELTLTRKLIVISRLGPGESNSLSRERLKKVSTYLGSIWKRPSESVVLASGDRIGSNGRLEFYVGGELGYSIILKPGRNLVTYCNAQP